VQGGDFMSLESLIDLAVQNPIIAAVVVIVVLFILFRSIRTARMYLGAKSYVKKARKLDKRKFNGLDLVSKTARRRKRDSNSFNKLRGRAKKWVRRYFSHKMDELPIITKFSRGKLFKRSNNRLIIIVKNERKTIKKITMKKAQKELLNLTNKYECLDEMITFLHNLPEVILDDQEYDVYIAGDELVLSYIIK
jgi:septum formation topological specificity factor MinE